MERIDYRAETSSKRTNQPLDLCIAGQRANLARILLPPNPSPSLSLSIVILATSQARYFIIISSLSRLPGFRRTTLFPANDWNPGCCSHRFPPLSFRPYRPGENYFPPKRHTHTAPSGYRCTRATLVFPRHTANASKRFNSANTWTIGQAQPSDGYILTKSFRGNVIRIHGTPIFQTEPSAVQIARSFGGAATKKKTSFVEEDEQRRWSRGETESQLY